MKLRHAVLAATATLPRRVRNLTVLAFGILLAISMTVSPAHAGARNSNFRTAAGMESVAGGTVTSTSGAAAPGAVVDLYAWPSDAVLKAMEPGTMVPTTLLATATTNRAGKYMLQVSATKLMSAAVESGYANLEIYSPVGGMWFLSYQTSALPAHPSAPTTVNLSPDIGVNCGKNPNGGMYAFSGFMKQKQLHPAFATIGQGYIVPDGDKTKGDSLKFLYNQTTTKNQTSTLGLGVSGYGIDAGYKGDGSSTSTATKGQGFGSDTKNTWFRTLFNVARFRGMCHGHFNDNTVPQEKQHSPCPRKYTTSGLTFFVHKCFWMDKSTGWFGPSGQIQHPKSSPATPGKFCGQEPKNGTAMTSNGVAVQWSKGFDIGVSNKVKNVTLKASFSSTAQTGYDSNAQMIFTFGHAGWICGTNHDTGTAAQLVMRGNKA